jgi:hypothetical protein
MQRLEVSGAVRPLYGSLGVKGFMYVQSPFPEEARLTVLAVGGPRIVASCTVVQHSLVGLYNGSKMCSLCGT